METFHQTFLIFEMCRFEMLGAVAAGPGRALPVPQSPMHTARPTLSLTNVSVIDVPVDSHIINGLLCERLHSSFPTFLLLYYVEGSGDASKRLLRLSFESFYQCRLYIVHPST